ncbi:MAG: hypothetical protein ACR2OA_20295 [Rubripirellula sp.]
MLLSRSYQRLAERGDEQVCPTINGILRQWRYRSNQPRLATNSISHPSLIRRTTHPIAKCLHRRSQYSINPHLMYRRKQATTTDLAE